MAATQTPTIDERLAETPFVRKPGLHPRRARGLGVIFITHNVYHAYPVGEAFTILNRGRTYSTFRKEDVSREKVLNMTAGGKELDELSADLEEFSGSDAQAAPSHYEAGAAAEHAIADRLHQESEALQKR